MPEKIPLPWWRQDKQICLSYPSRILDQSSVHLCNTIEKLLRLGHLLGCPSHRLVGGRPAFIDLGKNLGTKEIPIRPFILVHRVLKPVQLPRSSNHENLLT
jgi:hypothetical protein